MATTARESGKTHKSASARYQMYIDGRFVDAKSKKTFDVFDPSTEDAIASVPAGDAADIDQAARAATKAFYDGWKTVTAQERGRILFRLAERVRARRTELAELETRNTGKPIAESEYDMTTPPPASSTTAGWQPRSMVRCSRYRRTPWLSL